MERERSFVAHRAPQDDSVRRQWAERDTIGASNETENVIPLTMRIIPITDEAVHEAAHILREGGTVVYPTETAYGLAADPFNITGVRYVFELKGRADDKPLGLLASSMHEVGVVAELHPDEERLTTYWPGALSLVLDARFPENPVHAEAFRAVCAGGTTVSIRISSNAWAAKLARTIGYPIIATSANRSGQPACYALKDVLAQFTHARKPDLLLDAGELPKMPTSTVVRVEKGEVIVLREGAVKIKR